MGYRSDVRIVTSKQGFEKLKEYVEKYLKEHNEKYNLLENLDTDIKNDNECYFGWNSIKWYDFDAFYEHVRAIMHGLDRLQENEYSYRYAILGENNDDYEEQYYEGNRDGEEYLEFPSLIREFDDSYMESLLKSTNNKLNEENKEDIEYGGSI